MYIKRFVTDMILSTNTYVVYYDQTRKGMVIDPGAEITGVVKYIEDEGVKVEYVINTHAHPDHCAGNAAVCDRFNVPLFIHR